MSDLLIRNCDVLNVTIDARAFVLFDHDILISGNRIEAVQPTGQADPSHFRQVIDGRGQVAMPGLINTHAHTPMVLFRGLAEDVPVHVWFNEYIWPLENNLIEEDVYWGMQLGLAEMIRGGVTSVADHYFHMDGAAKAVEKAGSRALLGWCVFGSNGQEMIERSGRFVQEWQGAANGRIRTLMAPHAPYTCDDDYLRAVVKKAKELGVGIHIHAAEEMFQTENSLSSRGKTPIQVLEEVGVLDGMTIIAHGNGIIAEDYPILTRHQVGFAQCTKGYLKHASGTAPLLDFRKLDIPFGLGSDGAVSNNTLDIFEVMRLMPMAQKNHHHNAEVMPIPEVLYIATRDSARVYGQPDDLGNLDPGSLADIILVDMTQPHTQPLHSIPATLVYNTRASDVQTVIIDGQVVMKNRELLTLDEGEIISYAVEHKARLAYRDTNKRIQTYAP